MGEKPAWTRRGQATQSGDFPKENLMNTGILEPAATLRFQTAQPGAMRQLTIENIEYLLEILGPLVLLRNLKLDLTGVERIDAAGISMLLTLYSRAREAGNQFSLVNVPTRVLEILSVVGLDRLLLSHNPVQSSQYGSGLHRSAA